MEKTLQCEVHLNISGESSDVSGITVELWKERVCELVEGYAAEDIWKQGVFGKPFQIVVLPKKELHVMVVRNQKELQ